jgi:uncharacterized protein
VKDRVAAPKPEMGDEPFWRKPLEELSKAEWESLCDGCGRCCLVKLEEEDSGEIHFTNVGCRLLDASCARCADYGHRSRRVPDCVRLDPASVRSLSWLPPTCAYRLVANGADLPEWHPLVSGRKESVVEAGISVIGKVAALESEVEVDDLVDYIVAWPGKFPKTAKKTRPQGKKARPQGMRR